MPTQGVSLVGFMNEPQAFKHFREACCPADTSDAALRAEFQAAQARLGAPVQNAGQPGVMPLPASHALYAAALFQLPWIAAAFQGQATAANVELVEVAPLLAYQFLVDNVRCDQHCGALATPPTVDELFAVCLPTSQPSENFAYQIQGQSALIKSRSLNLRVQAQGITNNSYAGIIFGPALAVVQVTRFNGRCYLHNGYHRAVGLRRRGATHIPCVLRDVATAEAAGIRIDGATFSEQLLTSANPPTVGHLCDGRAYPVMVRATSRILHVSWADYIWPEE